MASFADLKVGDEVRVCDSPSPGVLFRVDEIGPQYTLYVNGVRYSAATGLPYYGVSGYPRLLLVDDAETEADPDVATLTGYNWQALKDTDPDEFKAIFDRAMAAAGQKKKGGE